MNRLTIWRTQADPDGNQLVETWTKEKDGLTAARLHQSGALMVYTGLDGDPVKVISFGGWSEYTCE